MSRWIGVILFATAAPTGSVSAEPISFNDGDYPEANWSVLPTVTLGGGGSTTTVTDPANGNPAANRRTFIDLDPDENGDAFVWSVQINSLASYTPSTSGPISSIVYSEEFAATEVGGMLVDCYETQGMGFGMALRQDGRLYIARPNNFTFCSTQWSTASSPELTAASFEWLDGVSGIGGLNAAVHPDFTSLGSTIELGTFRQSGTLEFNDRVNNHRFDNWSVTLERVPLVPAMSWGPWPLLASLLAAAACISTREIRARQIEAE